MPDNELIITLTLKDELTARLQQAAEAVNEMSDDMKKLGREMSQAGQKIAFFGAAISGPFLLAMREAAKTNDDVAKSFRQIESASQKLNNSIASSLIPIFQTFTGLLVTLTNAWMSLSQSTRDFIVQATFISGIVLTIIGVITILIGKLIALSGAATAAYSSFLGFLSLNPLFLPIIISLGLILALMLKFKPVADTITSTFEVLFRFLYNGVLSVATILSSGFKVVIDWLTNIVDVLGKIPGPQQELFQNMEKGLRSASNAAEYFSNVGLYGIIDNTKKIGDILKTGQGEWSSSFQIGIDKLGEFGNAFGKLNEVGKKASDDVVKSWTETWNQGKNVLGQLGSALQGAAAQNKKFAVAAQVVSIGMAVMNVAEGVTAALKWGIPLGPIFAGIIAAAGAIQIATIASQSFAVGTPNVPSDMTAQIHKGETIIPATFADAIRKGDLSLSGGGGGIGGGDILINLYGITINSKENVRELAEELGFEIDRKFRNARSRA